MYRASTSQVRDSNPELGYNIHRHLGIGYDIYQHLDLGYNIYRHLSLGYDIGDISGMESSNLPSQVSGLQTQKRSST
ncbi:hypothetical protein TNCV_4261131 [Trichonephila clavipes]|nr:hypothetical protein TNCV_4261131 [Trichonephila clavipes]